MSLSRANAIDMLLTRSDIDAVVLSEDPTARITSYYGTNVFGDEAMQRYLTEAAYLNVKAAIQAGAKLSRDVAETVADAMKKWATDKGATHYAHWFQPLTGKTAEKHDSFFTLKLDGTPIEEFKGNALAQQEPDGSSFPGGGLRSTFEARGYTAWDPSSPAFIYEVGETKTLCIPTIFVTYTGEAMDYKLPLLKSQRFLEDTAIPVCQYFDNNVNKVTVTLGWEQEYFLIDDAFYNARPDLFLTGRTLVGKYSPKGQQLEDHYFGAIPERVLHFMRDLEIEAHKLGIPVRTRHNEVAPGQYELAPMFEEVNVAVDHNQLLMDLMERIATRHKLRVLLHEKPFAGVNGSGKHNNWSMSTNTGVNLLSPGHDPSKNLRFLTFFVNTIKAVHEYADLLRASVASAGNDHRLGANEAPPAIISVYVGEALTKVLNAIADGGDASDAGLKEALDLVAMIPDLEKDNTDRNRTSPFAFTGNKFEIRMVGSSMNCGAPMTIMNTIVGNQLRHFKQEVDKLVQNGYKTESAVLSVVKDYIKQARPILFEGDGYSEEWKDEAAERGLANMPNTPDALKAYLQPKVVTLFGESGVLSSTELHAHYDVMVEGYCKKIQIESRTIAEMAYNYILPAAIEYQTVLAKNIESLKSIGLDKDLYEVQTELVTKMSKHIKHIYNLVEEMTEERKKANHTDDVEKRAHAYCYKVLPHLEKIRYYADKLEGVVDDKKWPLVKYREMLFLK